MIEKTEDYLMDLLGRSLVIVSKRSDDGQIKACHVHDLLRSLCMWKEMEEGFSPISYRYGRVSSAMYPVPDAEVKNNPLPGMSSEHSTQHIDFVLCCPIELGEWESLLEDFSSGNIIGMLENLQTISGVSPSSYCLSILTRTPNLRKLGFCGPLISTLGFLEFPNVCSFNCLKMLKLSNTMRYYARVKSCNPLMFPERLTRLTLCPFGMAGGLCGLAGGLCNMAAGCMIVLTFMYTLLLCVLSSWIQHSAASSLGLSGIANNEGNREQVISSMAMGNLVNGGNIGRSLSSGGLNMHGVAARLNLTGNCGPKDYK
ncbi:hypothetical protein R6Q57_014568 [Mikania cordata]